MDDFIKHEHDADALYITENVKNAVNDAYDAGAWDMFVRISSAEFGKQCYFKQDGGMVYSRRSCRYITEVDAIKEFIEGI